MVDFLFNDLIGYIMSKRTSKDKKIQKNIANRRIRRLFVLAEENALSGKIKLADRYVELARKISMRYLVSIPGEFKRSFCKHCYKYLLPGENCRVRIHRGKLVIYCNSCKKYTRIPLKNSKM